MSLVGILAIRSGTYSQIISKVKYKNWVCRLNLDEKTTRFYFQWVWGTQCNKTGKPYEAKSRKWYLSEHMTDTEIINTLFMAVMIAEEHEIREQFQYRPTEGDPWRAPFNGHIDINSRYDIAEDEDIRKE